MTMTNSLCPRAYCVRIVSELCKCEFFSRPAVVVVDVAAAAHCCAKSYKVEVYREHGTQH